MLCAGFLPTEIHFLFVVKGKQKNLRDRSFFTREGGWWDLGGGDMRKKTAFEGGGGIPKKLGKKGGPHEIF